jgi:hypothetical protein
MRDRHLQIIAERGRKAWQKVSGYHWRALVEADISPFKRVIGDGLRSRTDRGRATEVAIAVYALNRMLELGRPAYVRFAYRHLGWLKSVRLRTYAHTPVTRQTKPPAYFTQASWLDAMVNIDLYIDRPRAKPVLGGPTADQKRSIGTGATRANIIRTVFDRKYVEERGTAIHTTARGSAFIALARRLVPWMVNPIHAVEQEAALQDSEAGHGDDAADVREVLQRTQETLVKLKATGDSTRIKDAAEPPAKARQALAKKRLRGSGATAAVSAGDAKRGYFSVPYEKREEARAAGLRWDSETRKWYAPSPEIAARIRKARAADGERALPAARQRKTAAPSTAKNGGSCAGGRPSPF